MATPVRTSMRTRRSKRPASPVSVDDKRKKKLDLPVASDAPVDVVTVTPDDATTSLLKPKLSTPDTRQTVAAAASKDSSRQKAVSEPTPRDAQQQLAPEPMVVSVAAVDPSVVVQPEYRGHCFKDPNFVHSSKGGASAGKKSRVWKTLKQIAAAERSLAWKPGQPTYSSLEAPPSFKPAKKYSDLSGFQAKYTDPHTKLRYATTEEFSRLRMLPQDIVTGLLALRKANTDVP